MTIFLRSLISDTALNQAYDLRKQSRPDEGGRTSINISVGLGLLFLVMTALVAAGWVPNDIGTYLQTTEGIAPVSDEQIEWSMSAIDSELCLTDTECRIKIRRPQSLTPTTLQAIDQQSNPLRTRQQIVTELIVNSASWKSLAQSKSLILSIPRFNFSKAEIFIDGKRERSFFDGERVYAALQTSDLQSQDRLKVHILFTLEAGQRALGGVRNGEPVLFSTLDSFERMQMYVNSQKHGTHGAIGFVAKIAIAAFCLLLFIIIDSSPESLGLALFMGFEAIAMAIGRNWLPLQLIPGLSMIADHQTAIVNFCYQMGDIMKLYFLLQISRYAHKGTIGWLLIGTAISIPYGLFMESAIKLEYTWTYLLPLTRDTIVGSIGMIMCFRSAWVIRNKKLPWRMAALLLAGSAALGEVVSSHLAHSTLTHASPILQTFYTLVQANIGYLFAVSTFINISTLENRVRALSHAQAQIIEVERELEIGRQVQKSLLSSPRIPPGIGIECLQDAARYVSGDTYFLDWDPINRTFTFILTDVTGHGIQAALKASASNIIAKTIWSEAQKQKLPSIRGGRLLEYERLNRELLVENNSLPEFHSLIAAEYQVDSRTLSIFRSNFTFPILISPKSEDTDEAHLGGKWQVEPLVIPNQKLTHYQLKPNSFVIFVSDGIVDASRKYRQLIVDLRRSINATRRKMTALEIKQIFVDLRKAQGLQHEHNDDQTFMVFESGIHSQENRLTERSAS